MEEIFRIKIRATIEYVVNLLVTGAYKELELFSAGIRLKAEYIEMGVSEYGRTLVSPPQKAYDDIDMIPVTNTEPQEFSVRFRLYTQEEGKSDLEIQLTLIDKENPRQNNLMCVEVDNILVA